MAVDLSTLACTNIRLLIVHSSQQPYVIHLWDTRGKELNRSGSIIRVIIISQHGVVCSADLMHIKAVRILMLCGDHPVHIATAFSAQGDDLFDGV
ncbi:hypothetical protein SDC9_210854 [bioreactor metagenome]|uniref:Uncharacterized protein n=1 Tax=bioreactor metagenome TaxID=1076179 RepID=A0A645JJ09_9ZZZZ